MISQADKDQTVADFQAVVDAAQAGLDHANALEVDTTDVAALQQQIADLTAENATLTQQVADLTQQLADMTAAKDAATQLADSAVAERDKARDQITRIVAKMDAADAADVAEDQARAGVRAIAAE